MTKVTNPPNELWLRLASKRWEDATMWFRAQSNVCADQAKAKLAFREYSLFPLHFALEEGAPTKLIKILIRCYPEAAKHHYKHDLPIHLAIVHKRSFDIIKSLVNAWPQAIHKTCNGVDLTTLVHKVFGRQHSVTMYIKGKTGEFASESTNPIHLSYTSPPSIELRRNCSREVTEREEGWNLRLCFCDIQANQERVISLLSDLQAKQSELSDKSRRLEIVSMDILQTLATFNSSAAAVEGKNEVFSMREEFLRLIRDMKTEIQALNTMRTEF